MLNKAGDTTTTYNLSAPQSKPVIVSHTGPEIVEPSVTIYCPGYNFEDGRGFSIELPVSAAPTHLAWLSDVIDQLRALQETLALEAAELGGVSVEALLEARAKRIYDCPF